ncbi:protein EVI2B [Ambystoma mexicanum]|uniref:protein EVI2B n=1 Tax=Ambystoma mexicanum TaxID=8296 RepID=UPI0037E9C0CA
MYLYIIIFFGQIWRPLHVQANILRTSLGQQTSIQTSTPPLQDETRQTTSKEHTMEITFSQLRATHPTSSQIPSMVPTTPKATSKTTGPTSPKELEIMPTQKETTRTSNSLATFEIESTSSTVPLTFVSHLNEMNKETSILESSQISHLETNESEAVHSKMAQIFAYLIGSILMLMIIAMLVIWKRVAKKAPLDANWAGRSPLADGDTCSQMPIPKENLMQDIQRLSITSSNSLSGMFHKNQLPLEGSDIQANGSKDNLGTHNAHDGHNEVSHSNSTVDNLNKCALAPILTVPDEFEGTTAAIEPQSTESVNLPPPSSPPVSPNAADRNSLALVNHLESPSTGKQPQRESELFPYKLPCILNDDFSLELPLPPPPPEEN